MATTFEFVISCPPERSGAAQRCLSECHARVEELEDALTEFRASSPVAVLNGAAVGARVPLPNATWELLDLSLRIEDLSAHAFSCSAKSKGSTAQLSTRGRIGLDFQTRSAQRLDPDLHIGFGAIGKGFALDRCRELLERAGFTDYLLSGGGSSLVMAGFAGPETPWTWAWSWSRDAKGSSLGIPLSHPTGTAIAIGVSGLHEKGLHLIDPRAGRAAQSMRSALVAHPSAAWADALSTALFVGGWNEALQHFNELLQPPALAVIDGAGIPRWNGPFQALFGSLEH